MGYEEFLRAIPKVDLRVTFGGVFRKDTLMLIAEQNDIPSTMKKFKDWTNLLDAPDYKRLDEIRQTVSTWLVHPDDLSRLVYDMGVILARDNVKYAEVLVNPSIYMAQGMTFEQFLTALNDGRDRAQRGWGIQMRWILTIHREEPRKSDEIVRWATSATGGKGGVVAMILAGDETIQPPGQFVRAFNTAHKKNLPSGAYVGMQRGPEGITETLQELSPDRYLDVIGLSDADDAVDAIVESGKMVNICPTRDIKHGWVESLEVHPVRRIFDADIPVTVSADMSTLYQATLSDNYALLLNEVGLSLDEVEEIALNGIRYSFMLEDEKVAMLEVFQEAFERLRDEHIVSSEEAT